MINLILLVPTLIIFAWPYQFLCKEAGIDRILCYPGSMLFAAPFVITILHGHVTLALGSLHRDHYYTWLTERPATRGVLFHPLVIRTRTRITLLAASLVWAAAAWMLPGSGV